MESGVIRWAMTARRGGPRCAPPAGPLPDYWLAGELTWWNLGGIVTRVLAMLAVVGRSHCRSVTVVNSALGAGPP